MAAELSATRTLEEIDLELEANNRAVEALDAEINNYSTKLATLQEQYAEANRLAIAGKKSDPATIRTNMHTIEFHLSGLREQLSAKEAQRETLHAERQPLALQKAKESEFARLAKMADEADQKRRIWLDLLEKTRVAESAFYEARKRHGLERDRIAEAWSKLRISAVA